MHQVDLHEVKKLCMDGKILWRDHAAKRLKERNIKTIDVERCIATGEIIEQYIADYPVPSCLILGLSTQGQPLHVVCSVYQDVLCIITNYFPNTHEWENDFKTRKVER